MFYVFAFEDYEAGGGLSDLSATCPTLDEAIQAGRSAFSPETRDFVRGDFVRGKNYQVVTVLNDQLVEVASGHYPVGGIGFVETRETMPCFQIECPQCHGGGLIDILGTG